MQRINKLGLVVAGVTAAVVIASFGIYRGIKSVFFSQEVSPSPSTLISPTPALQTSEPLTSDTDNDGLLDIIEQLYRTDPQKSDTDNDGVSDSEELSAGEDPRGNAPGATPVPNLGKYTEEYLSAFPDNATREEIFDKTKIGAFVDKKRSAHMFDGAKEAISLSADEGKETVAAYLDTISATHNDAITSVTIEDISKALAQASSGNQDSIDAIINSLTKNLAIFRSASAPKEAEALHRKLLGTTASLLENTKLLKNIKGDYIGSLIGAKNIEEVGTLFAVVASDIKTLEEKYEL